MARVRWLRKPTPAQTAQAQAGTVHLHYFLSFKIGALASI